MVLLSALLEEKTNALNLKEAELIAVRKEIAKLQETIRGRDEEIITLQNQVLNSQQQNRLQKRCHESEKNAQG